MNLWHPFMSRENAYWRSIDFFFVIVNLGLMSKASYRYYVIEDKRKSPLFFIKKNPYVKRVEKLADESK
jgi:hypothetical protein